MPGSVLAVVAVAVALASLKSETTGYAWILITGLAVLPVMSLLMRLALVSNGLESGVVSAMFMRALLIGTAIGTVTVGVLVFAISLAVGPISGEKATVLASAANFVLLVPGFFAIIFGRRLFMMDRIISDGYGIFVNERFLEWISRGIEPNRSDLRAIRALHSAAIVGGMTTSVFAEGNLLIAVQIAQLVLGCVVWTWYGAALRDIFFGGLEERERRLVPVEAT